MELRDRIAALIWDHLRPKEDTTPVADAILAMPEIAEALARPKPFNPGYTVITGTGRGARKHVPPTQRD